MTRLTAALLVLPLLGAVPSGESVAPVRTAVGTMAGTTTITWSGTTGIRLRLPSATRLLEEDVRLWAADETTYAFVRGFEFPHASEACQDLYRTDVCFVQAVDWTRTIHHDGNFFRQQDPSRRRGVQFSREPTDKYHGYLDLYLLSDGPVTVELHAAELDGAARYEPTGVVTGTAQRLPVSCLPDVCCPAGCGEGSSSPELLVGPSVAFGGAARDVGPLGFAQALAFATSPPESRWFGRENWQTKPCLYPGVSDPEASPAPEDHPYGCDIVPEPREGAVLEWVANSMASTHPGASGPTYAGFRVQSEGPDRTVNAGYGLWFSYGIGVPVSVERVAGGSRLETAVAVAGRAFPDGAGTVVLARADTFPDALAGAPLAFQAGGPILLTGGERLDPVVAEEIGRLGAKRAVLLGGTGSLSARVEADLAAIGVEQVERVAGANRFATAAAIADRVGASEAFVVAADDPDRGWPDALAVGAIAARRGAAILLVGSETIPAETRAALGGIDRAVIVGGPAAVSEAVETELGKLVGQVERVAGASRYATNVALLDRYSDAAGPLWVATGLGFPDALAAGPAGAATDGRLLLVDGGDLTRSPAAADWYRRSEHANVLLIGGPTTLTPNLEQQLQ